MFQNVYNKFHRSKTLNFVYILSITRHSLQTNVHNTLVAFEAYNSECRVPLFFMNIESSTLIDNSLISTNKQSCMQVVLLDKYSCICEIGMPYKCSMSCYQSLAHITSRTSTTMTLQAQIKQNMVDNWTTLIEKNEDDYLCCNVLTNLGYKQMQQVVR